MGREALTTAWWNGESGQGRALLESDHLLFRGPFRVKVPFAAMQDLTVSDGRLRLTLPDGVLELALGAQAADWADRIRNPKGLLDKLGIHPGAAVALFGAAADPVLAEALARAGCVVTRPEQQPPGLRHAILCAGSASDLAAVTDVAAALDLVGMLWIVYPKGSQDPTQDDVFRAGRGAGLADTKVCSVSAVSTALKFVRRKEKGAGPRR